MPDTVVAASSTDGKRPDEPIGIATAVQPWVAWSPAILLLCVCGFELSYLGVRAFVSSVLVVLAAPVLLALRTPRAVPWDRSVRRIVLVLLAFVAWMAVQLLWAPSMVELGLGRCLLLAAAVAIAMAVAADRPGLDALVPAVGMGALAALTVSLVGVWITGYDGFGLGNTNHLLNSCSPAQLGWAAYMLVRWRQGRRPPAWQVAGLLALTVLLWHQVFYAIPGIPRRGVILAALATVGVFGLIAVRRRFPRTTAAAVGVVAGGALVAAAWLFSQPVSDPRQERVLIYTAAWQAAIDHLPLGAGNHATLRMHDETASGPRHLSASNAWAIHSHSEPLEILLCGGLPGAALAAAFVVLLAMRLRRIADPSHRAAAIAIAAGIAVHAATDNILSIPSSIAWYGVLLGVLLRADTDAAQPRPARWPRLAGLTLGAVCAAAMVREVPTALVSFNAGPEERTAAIRTSCMADFICSQWSAALDGWLYTDRPTEAAACAAMLMGKLDGGANSLLGEIETSGLCGEAARVRLTEALRAIAKGRVSAVSDARDAAAEGTEMDRRELAATLRYLHRTPFHRFGYEHLDPVLTRRPDLLGEVPAKYVVRLRYRRGDRALAPPTLREPRDVEEAADAFAGLMWAHQNGWDAERMSPCLEGLVARFGDIPDVALLVVEMSRDLPPGSFPWIDRHRGILARAAEKIYPADRVRLLDSIQTPAQAAAAWSILRWLYPRTGGSVEQHRMDRWRENADPIWERLVRVWGLSLRHAREDAR